MDLDKKNIQLNKDEEEILETELKLIFRDTKAMNHFYKKNMLDKEMNANMIGLLEGHIERIKQATHYDGPSKVIEDLHQSGHKMLQNRVEELKKQLRSEQDVVKIKEGVSWIYDILNKWWDEKGFNFLNDFHINSSGYIKAKLGFNIQNETMIQFSKNPATEKEKVQRNIQYWKDKGINLTEDERNFIDSDINKKYFIELIKEHFPSSIIIKFDNHIDYHQDEFILRHIEVMIKDIEEVVNLKNQYLLE